MTMRFPDDDYDYDPPPRPPLANFRDNYAAGTLALRAQLDAQEAAEEAAYEQQCDWLRARRHRARPDPPSSLHCMCRLAVEDHDAVLAAELAKASERC